MSKYINLAVIKYVVAVLVLALMIAMPLTLFAQPPEDMFICQLECVAEHDFDVDNCIATRSTADPLKFVGCIMAAADDNRQCLIGCIRRGM